MVVEAKGEIAALAETINNMTDTLGVFAEQVTTVAREVGIEGKLGGQARVPGVAGTWKDLTDNVNFMASNLTTQVRGIVKVVTAVANGDLSQKLVGVEAKGEIAALADTINDMCDTLGTFADQVTTVAREVGIEGKLGGQAKVPGAMGTWRQLTDNVNQLAGNLTSQVRAISDVATAVTKGDLTRVDRRRGAGGGRAPQRQHQSDDRQPEGDDAEEHRAGLAEDEPGQVLLHDAGAEEPRRRCPDDHVELTPLVSAHHGAFFMMEAGEPGPVLKLTSTYAYRERKDVAQPLQGGRGAGRAVRATRRRPSCSPGCPPTTSRSAPASARRRRSTSSCCRCCSRGRSRRSSSWPRSTPSAPSTSCSSTSSWRASASCST